MLTYIYIIANFRANYTSIMRNVVLIVSYFLTLMKSTKAQNPRRIPRKANNARLLVTLRHVAALQFSLVRGARCIGIMLSLGHGRTRSASFENNLPRCAERANSRKLLERSPARATRDLPRRLIPNGVFLAKLHVIF